MLVFLHRKRLVSPLVHVPQPHVMSVLLPAPHMRDRQPLHEIGQVPVVFRPKKKMPVIGKDAIRTNPHRRFFSVSHNDPLERLIIPGLLEHLHPRNAAVENMKHHSSRSYSCCARHRQRLANIAYFVNIGPVPFSSPADVTGLKYFEKLAPLLERLHDVGCERDRAGNRDLHYDQFCLLLLLGLFNPMVDSLRGLQQASELEKVQKRLQLGRASLGSLSEASRVFDAELLKPIIEELGAELKPLGRDPRLAEVPHTLTLVDGTLLSALPILIQAMWLKEQTGSGLVKWRLHTHFEVDRFVPTRIDVTPNGGGEHDERAVLERTLEADRLYVMDRGYAKFALFNQIVTAGSSYVCRLRDNSLRGPGRAAAHGGRPRGGRAERPNGAVRQRQARRSAGPPRAVDLCGHLAPTPAAASTAAVPPGPAATACCGSPPTCWTCRRRSSA